MRIGLVSTASLNHTVAFARVKTQTDATALCRGDSRSRLQRKVSSVCGCHGLVPWRLKLAATKKGQQRCGCHGLVPWRLTLIAEAQALVTEEHKREPPRR